VVLQVLDFLYIHLHPPHMISAALYCRLTNATKSCVACMCQQIICILVTFLVNSEEIIRPNLSIREGIGRVLNLTHILLGYCAMQAAAALLVNVTGSPL
jgi:hypothetical protein